LSKNFFVLRFYLKLAILRAEVHVY
jgi:hypothetical protein